MLSAGLPLTRAISITARVIENYYVSQEIGKLSGRLEEGHGLGTSLRDELEQAINAAIAKLEPTLLVFMAVVAGFIVIAVYMAMFSMYSVM